MSVQVKRRRDTAANLASFVGAQAELLVDTTNNRLQVHDGITPGGWPAAKLTEVVTNARTAIADADYTALASDRTIAYTVLTAARMVSLPAASAYPTGTRLLVIDESGACSATNVITLAAAGTDTIDAAASAVIACAYGYLALQSNGAGKWAIVDQAASNLAGVGIGTPLDPSNPLSVYGTNALFASGSDIRIKLNKASSANSASFLFQDSWSGRAEISLTGDDNFHFKVSPDGSTWYDALDIAGTSGLVTAHLGLVVNANSASPSAPTNTVLYLVGADGVGAGLTFDSYGSAVAGNMRFRHADGTAAHPTAVATNDVLGTISWFGYGATGFSAAARVAINAKAADNWTDSDQGTFLTFSTTPIGGTSVAECMRIDNTGYVGIGTTTPAQTLDVAGAIAIGGTLSTGPDRSIYLGSYTVTTLPAAGHAGRLAFVSNGRMYNGAGTLEASGAGTGGLVVDNGTAWKIAGTNQTVQA